MTPQKQRIAIAEWMGWRKCACGDVSCGAVFPPNSYEPELGFPDYPNDLNEMQEAEKKLDDKQYFGTLVTKGYCDILMDVVGRGRAYSATSQQRSEALCRTLWPERF